MATMNQITISLIFYIMISMVLPASAIMYASGQSTDNSDGSSTTDNSGSSTTGGGSTDNSGSSTGGSKGNSPPLPTTSTLSNNTVNGQQQSNNATTGILESSNNESVADFANHILAVHNAERVAVGVQPLVWSDKLAADAKTWADYMAATHNFRHDAEHLGNLGEGENLNSFVYNLGDPPSTAKLQEGWVNEKNYYQQWATNSLPKTANWTGWYPGHYNQMVWKTTKEVGCATGFTSGLSADSRGVFLDCRYSPPGNILGQKPY